jgi:hypothetical protein
MIAIKLRFALRQDFFARDSSGEGFATKGMRQGVRSPLYLFSLNGDDFFLNCIIFTDS